MTKVYRKIKPITVDPLANHKSTEQKPNKQAPLLLLNPIEPEVSPLVLDAPVASETSEAEIRNLFREVAANLNSTRQQA